MDSTSVQGLGATIDAGQTCPAEETVDTVSSGCCADPAVDF